MVGVADAGAVSRPSKLVIFFFAGIPQQHERAAADAGRFRLDQRQHHLRRDGRIHRRSARAQHLKPAFTA